MRTLAAALLSVALLFGGVFGMAIPASASAPAQYKSVILLIGDGMGENTLNATLAANPS